MVQNSPNCLYAEDKALYGGLEAEQGADPADHRAGGLLDQLQSQRRQQLGFYLSGRTDTDLLNHLSGSKLLLPHTLLGSWNVRRAH